jgi:N4-(beta-N-acetylglucosaminyl)-L-asparaginase
MAGDGRAGSACFLQGIKHPVSLARMVMDTTPHVMIVGAGAERFARENGMKQLPNDLSEAARKAWLEWVKEKNYKPVINIENHDTIGLLARDAKGRMAGACTTSGLAYKIHGRVGDSPIIGAGLFVDDEVGGATCTGLGESVIRTSASTVAVERMRYGATPQEACEEAIRRIVKKHPNWKEFQVGILAVDKNGRHGAYALQKGFTYALNRELKTAEAYS